MQPTDLYTAIHADTIQRARRAEAEAYRLRRIARQRRTSTCTG
jgi:hypothetical protein